MQTILGANGNIGRLLARELTAYTGKIRLVSRHPKKVNDKDELYPADLSDPSVVDAAVAGSSIVYLVVGFEYKLSVWKKKWPPLMRATIDACKKYKAKLVFFDNVYAYDVQSLNHMTEDSALNPPSEKGKVRKEILEMLLNEMKHGHIRALIARSADFYGPNNNSSLLTEMVLKNLLKKKKANWFKSPDKIHSFTYTLDAAKATAILGNTDTAYGQTWHLPTSTQKLTGNELIRLFANEFGTDGSVQVMPNWLLSVLGIFIPVLKEMKEMLYQYDRDYYFDSTKFNETFFYKPVSYEEGVKQTTEAAKR